MSDEMSEFEDFTKKLHSMRQSADKNAAELVYESVKHRAYDTDIMNPSNVAVIKTQTGARLVVKRK